MVIKCYWSTSSSVENDKVICLGCLVGLQTPNNLDLLFDCSAPTLFTGDIRDNDFCKSSSLSLKRVYSPENMYISLSQPWSCHIHWPSWQRASFSCYNLLWHFSPFSISSISAAKCCSPSSMSSLCVICCFNIERECDMKKWGFKYLNMNFTLCGRRIKCKV